MSAGGVSGTRQTLQAYPPALLPTSNGLPAPNSDPNGADAINLKSEAALRGRARAKLLFEKASFNTLSHGRLYGFKKLCRLFYARCCNRSTANGNDCDLSIPQITTQQRLIHYN